MPLVPVLEANEYVYLADFVLQVVLVGHHPTSGGDIVVRHARWLTDLTTAYRDVVVLQVCGHTHNDEFRLVSILKKS